MNRVGVKKKVGIGFGAIIVSFVVLIIVTQIWWTSMTPEERQQIEEKRELREQQQKVDEEKKALQQKVDEEQEKITQKVMEYNKQIAADREKAKELEEKLSAEDMQKIVAGFEAYNKSVKILLDMCVNAESADDARQIGSLITVYGDNFLVNTSNYFAFRDKLVSEGYGDHPTLGPLLSESENLVTRMSTCMEMLAWEFGG
jgi:phosphoenolpyruvate-protein kinase (PTS system EI component)